jgi:hypothetical protein
MRPYAVESPASETDRASAPTKGSTPPGQSPPKGLIARQAQHDTR